jgi:8-oxo-dGTP pyrophosphatase MutT (NUDIX family)
VTGQTNRNTPRKVQPIWPAATVILVRDAHPDFEVFMLRRTSKAAFASGMYVFPGGRVDGDDHLHAYDTYRVGPADNQAPQQAALGAEWRGYWIAGIRESFEEAGLLLAYAADGRMVSYADPVLQARLQSYREPLHAGRLSLLDICERETLKLAVDHLHYFNRFVTPLGRPRRFDTRFFIGETPPEQVGEHDAKETVDSIWISPQQALARHGAKDFDLMRVTQMQLASLAAFESKDALLEMARNNDRFPVHRPAMPRD